MPRSKFPRHFLSGQAKGMPEEMLQRGLRYQMAYVNGYVLALEDILGDLDEVYADTMQGERLEGFMFAIETATSLVKDTLEQAKQTKATVEQLL